MESLWLIVPALVSTLQAPLPPTARLGSFREQVTCDPDVRFVTYAPDGRRAVSDREWVDRATQDGALERGEPSGLAVAPDGTTWVAWTGIDCLVRIGPLQPLSIGASNGKSNSADDTSKSTSKGASNGTPDPTSSSSLHGAPAALRCGRRGTRAGEMRAPAGIALDARAPLRVLVADTLNHRVDVFAEDGTPRGSFGTRGSGDGQLDHPNDVAVDARGHAFVADLGNDRVVEFDEHGEFVASFGGRGFHPGLFAAPSGVDVCKDELFVADRDNHRVQVLGLDGAFHYEWGAHALLPRESRGKFHYPCDVAVSPSGLEAAVLEETEDRIQVFGPLAGDAADAPTERDTSAHYAGLCSVRGDVLALLEPSGPAVVIEDLTRGMPIEITKFGRLGASAGKMMRPASVLLDASAEVVYVADPHASRISSFSIARRKDDVLRYEPDLARLVRSVDLRDPALALRGAWTIEPQGMALGVDGEILVADVANRRVVVFGADLSGPLRAIPCPLDPVGIAFDARTGRTYVTDPIARELCVLARDGSVETSVRVAGGRPFGVAVAPDGTVWVTDRSRGTLSKLDGDALAPLPDAGANATRTGKGELFEPEGVACDAHGRVFVVEAGNHRFQVFDARGAWLDMGGARFYTEAARTPPVPAVAHAWDGAHGVTTNGGTWRVMWRATPAVVPRADSFTIDAWVFAPGDPSQPVRDVDLRVDAWMPEHLHGMTRVPRIVRRDDGGFTAEGMLFHMSGAWELDFDVVAAAVSERAQTRVDLP